MYKLILLAEKDNQYLYSVLLNRKTGQYYWLRLLFNITK